MKRILLALALLLVTGLAAAQSGVQNSLRIFPEAGGAYSSQIRAAPGYVLARSLAASTAESITVPSGAKWVLFAATCTFYANRTTTATVPGDVTDGTASELNPTAWGVGDVTTISVISPTTCVITASFYR